MTKILILQNITREQPGLIAEALHERGAAFDIVNLDQGEAIPSLKTYAGLVVMGGPDSANDATPKMTAEIATVRVALSRNLPYLGICLGMQVLVKAAGGRVVKGETKEIGFHDPQGDAYSVELTPAGQADPVMGGLGARFRVFQLHGETVELTPDMELLARGAHCHNQIIRAGSKAYGIQSHFELTPDMLSVWADQDPDLTPLDKKLLLADYASIGSHYREVAATIFGRWLDLLQP